MRSYKAYSPAFFGKADINKGNKSITHIITNNIYSYSPLLRSARVGSPQRELPHDVHGEQPLDGQEDVRWSARVFRGRGSVLSAILDDEQFIPRGGLGSYSEKR